MQKITQAHTTSASGIGTGAGLPTADGQLKQVPELLSDIMCRTILSAN